MPGEILPRTLYLVATPIGNLSDITKRAASVLSGVDFIAAEDTRVTAKLLARVRIKKSVVSYHEHNKKEAGIKILSRLENGESCALVTDAGTPAISDPGEELVALARREGIRVIPIPGACAAIAALCVSGMSSRRFLFEGFLPSDKKERGRVLEECGKEKRTLIFYEAPHRLSQTLGELYEAFGEREICLARELTKLNEQIVSVTLSEARLMCEQTKPRGEYVLVVGGRKAEGENPFWESLSAAEHVAFYEEQGLSRMDAIKAAAKDRGVAKNVIYKALL